MNWTALLLVTCLLDLVQMMPVKEDENYIEDLDYLEEPNISQPNKKEESLSKSEMANLFKSLNLPENFGDATETLPNQPVTAASTTNVLVSSESPKVDGDLASSSSFGGHYHYGHYGDYSVHHDDNIFSSFVRLLIAIPSLKFSLLEPIILGLANTAVHATHGAAGVTAHVAKHFPAITETKAEVLKKLVETFGHATGTFLWVLSHLMSAAANAKAHFTTHHLPILLHTAREAGEGLANTVGTVTHGLSDITHIVGAGLIDSAKTKGKLVSHLVEGATHYKDPHGSFGWRSSQSNDVSI